LQQENLMSFVRVSFTAFRLVCAGGLVVSTLPRLAFAQGAEAPLPVPDAAGAPVAPVESTPSAGIEPQSAPSYTPPPPVPSDKGSSGGETAPRERRLFFELGGRVGYGKPYGKLVESRAMSDVFSGVIPLQFDAALRLKSGPAVGLFVGINPGIQGSALDDCSDCTLFDWRVGLQLSQHWGARRTFDPWLGVSLAYESTSVTQSYESLGLEYRSELAYSGFPEFGVHAGVDIGSEIIQFGPFLSATYGTYSKVTGSVRCVSLGCSGDAVTDTGSISDDRRAGHGWLLFGLRGVYLK
jgi:hypothetical protein